MNKSELSDMACMLRILCADMVENAGSGHPGMPMGMADVAATLYAKHLVYDPLNPNWIARDRFVLSAGHGSALAYALLYLIGQPSMTIEQLRMLRRKGSLTPGHPEFGHTPGIECTTGPLGQGFATAVGMAISEKKLRAELDCDLTAHKVYVVAGDGCLMEGISHEAGSLAGHLQLDNLIVLFDDNSISIDGSISITSSENVFSRFAAYGWHTLAVDGHDHNSIDGALRQAKDSSRPTIIACKTEIGRGAPTKGGQAGIHGSPLGRDEIGAMRKSLGWEREAFDLSQDILALWRETGSRSARVREDWLERLAQENDKVRNRILQIEHREIPALPPQMISAIRFQARSNDKSQATRISSKQVLEQLVPNYEWLLGGSADLSGSNGTRVLAHKDFGADDRSGTYLRYGVREHAMAAAMNGIALSGAYIPYGGTFLVFSDYCRPSIRLAALMGLKVIYIFTHDSIGLGEDGPTHQPVEHLAALRLIPGLRVFRPADAVEVAECWELAIKSPGPSVLALSRQDVPLMRDDIEANKSAKGAYILRPASEAAKVAIFATGSEVHLAVKVKDLLARRGIGSEAYSAPCLELIEPSCRKEIAADRSKIHVAIEAGRSDIWHKLLGRGALIFGVDGFGESASAEELFSHFGLDADTIADTIIEHISISEPV